MDNKGEIISSFDVDENIALQIWTKGLSPRLVILNKNQNSRKLIRFSWLENLDRRLSVKGKNRGESAEYCLADLLPHIQRIVSEYAVYASFKPRHWKFSTMLEKTLHAPAIVSDKGELALLPEDKRSCLWIADLTDGKRGEGHFRPFFPLSEKEKSAFPDDGLPITENKRGVEDLLKTGILRKLGVHTPLRWHRPVRVIGAAMLLGFSFCGADGSEFADDFWADEIPPVKIDDTRLCGLGRKFVGYARHFGALAEMETRTSLDSDKELMDEKYTRRRRIEFEEGLFGEAAYMVTFFEREDGNMALGCKPRAGAPRPNEEQIYTLPAQAYAQALTDDALGGTADDYFTVTQLVWAKAFERWLNNVLPYISSTIGAI